MHVGVMDLGDKYVKQRALNSSIVCCGLLSALPLIVGLTGAISAGLGAKYNAPPWNFKIGCLSLSAGILAYCSALENYTFAILMTLFGVSWLGGVYAQQQHSFISFGGNPLPVYAAFLMTAMFGALFGLCCGAVNFVSYCCFFNPTKTRSDLATLENMQRSLDRSTVV